MKKPSVFGKYLLLERLNVGGMAEVFAAKAFGVEGFERILAIKKILPTMAEDDEFITMFIDEARISVQLNHANVVHIHELGKHDDAYYIAMEYVSGKDLRALLERFRRRKEIMPTAMAVFITSKICEGLDYAHRKKDARGQELHIIHRDVSPQNILLSYEGEVKIIDFGIAKAANRSQKTQAGILKGKFGYMSPEQVRGLPIDRRSDIFAVGVILYEMLTGEKLFVGESDFSTLEKVRNADVPSPRQFNNNIPAGLEKVVMKSLAREAADRYQWGSDLQEDLMRFLLAGDAIYSSKHLSAFLKDAFAEDLLRENEKMERYASVERPDQVDVSGVTAAPTPRASTPQPAPAAPPRRNTQQPGSLAALSGNPPPRRPTQNVAVASGSGAVAMGLQQAKIEIPPPTEEELAEMDGNRDRTVIVDNSGSAQEESNSTAIGISPHSVKNPGGGSTEPAGRQLRPQAPVSNTSTTQDRLPQAPNRSSAIKSLHDLPSDDETLMPQPRNSLVDEDTGSHDLRPIEMTGFRAAMDVGGGDNDTGNNLAPVSGTGESEQHDPMDSTIPPRSAQQRPKIVIGGDAPVGGATSIGPSPFAKNETRMYESHDDGAEEGEEQAQDEENYDENQGQDDEQQEELQDEEQDQGEEEEQSQDIVTGAHAPVAPRRQPAKQTAKKAAGGDDQKRKMLLIAIAGTAALALIVIVAAAVKFAGGGKTVVGLSGSPQEVPYVTIINPGNLKVESPTKSIELEPGDYTFEFKPSVQGYTVSPAKKKVTVKSGAPIAIAVRFTPVEADTTQQQAQNTQTDTGNADAPKNEPKPEPTNEPTAAPTTWVAKLTSSEPKVEIVRNGKVIGTTPLEVKELKQGEPFDFVARKAGFSEVSSSLSNPDKKAVVEKDIFLDRVAAKEPEPKVVKNEPKPEPRNEPKPEPKVVKNEPKPEPKPQPKPEPKPVAAKGSGKAAFTSSPVGAEIWVDGKNTGKKTPLPKTAALEFSIGKHKAIFKQGGKASAPVDFDITADNKDNPAIVKGSL